MPEATRLFRGYRASGSKAPDIAFVICSVDARVAAYLQETIQKFFVTEASRDPLKLGMPCLSSASAIQSAMSLKRTFS